MAQAKEPHLYFPSLRPLFKLKLQHIPVSVGVACKLHQILVTHVRGSDMISHIAIWDDCVWCATLNKDEQLICWLFQKHSLMIASWNWLGQEFYAKYPCLWRMGTGNDSGPQQSKELIISLKSTNLRCCIGCMQINTFFKSIFAKTSWYFLTVCSSNAFLTSAFWGLT